MTKAELCNIETPDKGSIIVNGFDVTKKGKKQKYFKEVVGFLFQNLSLIHIYILSSMAGLLSNEWIFFP